MKTNLGVNISTVLWLSSLGFSVIPQYLRTKIPKFKWGKYQTMAPSETELRRWFSVPSNGAVVCGANNLMVIDFDDIELFTEWRMSTIDSPIAAYVANNAYMVKTARGVHVYTRYAGEIRNMHFDGIDIKGYGGLVTLPGSIHPSGYVYTEYGGREFPVVSDLHDVLPASMMIMTPQRIIERRISVAEMSAADVLDMDADSPWVDLEQIKERYKIEDMLPDVVMYSGSHWGVTKCPFHDDENPSFWVDTKAQLCGCFSGCTNVPLDAINLYARLHGISNVAAIKEMSR